jgi:hypothetical protein
VLTLIPDLETDAVARVSEAKINSSFLRKCGNTAQYLTVPSPKNDKNLYQFFFLLNVGVGN